MHKKGHQHTRESVFQPEVTRITALTLKLLLFDRLMSSLEAEMQ